MRQHAPGVAHEMVEELVLGGRQLEAFAPQASSLGPEEFREAWLAFLTDVQKDL